VKQLCDIGKYLAGYSFYLHPQSAPHTGWAKKCATLLLSISLPIIDQFSKFFHWHTLQTIFADVIIIDPTTP